VHDSHDRRPDTVGAAVVLSEAFDADPVFTLLFPHERPAALTAWFSYVVDVIGGCERGAVRAEVDAVAVWTTGVCVPCLERLDDGLTDLIRTRAGHAAVDLVARVQAAATPLDVPAASLHWLGARPPVQGHGHGSRLLAGIRRAAHTTHTALATTTANPSAVPFYERHGFAQVGVRDVPDAPGLRIWTLLAPVPA
jgi:GNAT superfamily N-acetyltransferase